jgi:hypothetical protein
MKHVIAAFSLSGLLAAVPLRALDDGTYPPHHVPGRKAPIMTMEQATQLARQAVAKQGTKVGDRFVGEARYLFDPSFLPAEMRKLADGPCWQITYIDPAHPGLSNIHPIILFVYGDKRVTIISSQ